MKKHEAPYYIVDYLIIAPKPGIGGAEAIDALVNQDWLTTELSELKQFLDGYHESFSYYVHTSWNVRGAG